MEGGMNMVRTITVRDGYNGSTVVLNAREILDSTETTVKLHVAGYPWLIRWVYRDEYARKLALAQEADDAEWVVQGPDTAL
jgi:hypothetical protein